MIVLKYHRIRELREDNDFTQTAVSKAINVSQRSYSYYENGERMIPPEILGALADFYNVSVDYLMGRTDAKKTSKL